MIRENLPFFRNTISALALAGSVSFYSSAQLTENFDNIATLTGSGWFMQNNSVPVGATGWFQGNPTVYPAFNGATNSYIGANFNNTTGANTISNWLVTPNFTIKNGDVITFYTRCSPDNMYPDNLQVRMSTNGTSTNVGTGSAAVGDFTTLLLEINPTLVTGVYPYTGWAQYTITISGLSAPTSGRFAFRYYVLNAGPSGLNSDYIGIDNFVYTPYVCPTLTVGPGSLANGTAGVSYSQSLSQTGALGTPTYTVTAGALPPGMTLSAAGLLSGTPTATGTFNFSVTVSDASGCSATGAFNLTIVCPTNGASLTGLPALCSNDPVYTLIEGSPAGGVYSGTGVSGTDFDPAAGSQMITYSLNDAYGCLQTTTATITVNTAPTVTLNPLAAVCDNEGLVTLSGGLPAPGNYSGTGVSGTDFDPSAGSQTITYTHVDVNGCTNSASQPITVNTAPTVTQSALTDVCSGVAAFALSGGSPVGGTYSGTGVTAGMFNPSTEGTFTITYTFTDANTCTNVATTDIDVVDCLGLNEQATTVLFTCYPNPTDGMITIRFQQQNSGALKIRIISLDGKIVMEDNKTELSGLYSKELDLNSFERGIYTVEITSNTGIYTQRVVLN